ncbi:hypothetical protein ACF06W_11805 [Streptomyces albus]|uniref:hypothetical protein n=1 Tax=Streptomyces albus TaxID=1888 RepID=UPI00370313EF
MAEQQVPGWHAAVVDAVREMEQTAADGVLLGVGPTSRRLVRMLEVTESTAVRYLREVIASGKLIEVGHVGRRLLLPWPEGMTEPPLPWVTGEVKRGTYRLTEYREPGPAMARVRFVFTPERLKQLMDGVLEQEAEKAAREENAEAKRRAEHEAEEAAEQALFAKHYPVLAGLLSRLHEQVHVPGRSARGVSFYANEQSESGVRARVQIEVGAERFDALEAVLSKALGEAEG